MKAVKAIEDFLAMYPHMSLKPSSAENFVIEGYFPVVAQYEGDSDTLVHRSFRLRIEIPISYPDELPDVYELEQGAQIPASPEYHKNKNLSLCLGSPLALLVQLSQDSSLVGFAKACIVPYLASAILKKEKGISFKQGELKHSDEGLEEDLAEHFGINLPLTIAPLIFSRLGEKKRKANKQPCPCGYGTKLGACSCSIHRFISSERRKEGYSRRFFRNAARCYSRDATRQKGKLSPRNKSLAFTKSS